MPDRTSSQWISRERQGSNQTASADPEGAEKIGDDVSQLRKSGFDDQAEAEIRRRYPGRTAALAGIADEIRHVSTVCTLDDANAAIGIGDLRRIAVESSADKAGFGPFPDIAA